MQLAAAGCRLGATCGIIRVSYTLKVGLDRDYSPALLLSCRYPWQCGCILHSAAALGATARSAWQWATTEAPWRHACCVG